MPLLPLAFAGVGGLAAIVRVRLGPRSGTDVLGPGAGADVLVGNAAQATPPWERGRPGRFVRAASATIQGIPNALAYLNPRRPGARPIGRLVLALVLALVVLYPLVPLTRYELDVLAANETNDWYYVTLGALEWQPHPGEPVVLDPTLQRDRTGAAGTAQRTFDFMLELRGIYGGSAFWPGTADLARKRIHPLPEGCPLLIGPEARC